jgi:elongation factor 1-alpha
VRKRLQNINIATVGHVDHGKSTLIGRLLFDKGAIKTEKKEEVKKLGGDFAFFMDHLEEERKEQRTIDVFYASLETDSYHFTFIDDPGHKEFIKNMLSGVSQADGVVLVVSAKEGIQEQTKRHMHLVKLLGISQVLVAINKMDTVEYDQQVYEKIKKEIGQLLTKLGYQPDRINFVPVSAEKGDNVCQKSPKMNWYQGKTFYLLLNSSFQPVRLPLEKPLRLPVQDIYRTDEGEFIVGKLETGTMKVNDLIFFPLSQIEGRVIKIKLLDESKNQAYPNESIGFQINKDRFEIQPGEVVCTKEDLARVRREIIGEVFLLASQEIQVGEKLKFRCGTGERECQIKTIFQRTNSESGKVLERNAQRLKAQELGKVRLRFVQALVVEKFSEFPSLGRFILLKKRKTIAVGICL